MSTPLIILSVIAGYFIVWLALSFISSKGADNSTFFTGNRRMPWPLVAIAMIGAPISGVTFISVPGMVMNKSFSYLQMGLGFIVGYLIIAWVLIPLYYRLNIVSIYGFLERRYGSKSKKTGAWLFFVSKMLGISVRFLVVCTMLQLLVFGPLGIPYIFSVAVSLGCIWLSTFRGGVKSVIWSDVLKSLCLFATIILCLWVITSGMDLSIEKAVSLMKGSESSRIFFFDDPSDPKYFWKQFIAGIFIVIAMTGLDQDMMQRSLTCRNSSGAKKNLVVSSLMQFVICSLLLFLGFIMLFYLQGTGMALPEKSDNLFATVAFDDSMPLVVGVLFILGLVSATYASVGSALTAMTTSVTVDLMEVKDRDLTAKRKRIHAALSIMMAILVILFYYLNNEDAISTVYTLISYTDGPILGLFLFGLLTKREVNERFLPVVCVAAPVISWLVQWSMKSFFDYQISFELLILNAALTVGGLWGLSVAERRTQTAA